MSIAFRSFTANARLSQETTAYDTKVMFQGKLLGTCRNDGRGGMGHFRQDDSTSPETMAAAEAWVKTQFYTEDDGTPLIIDGKAVSYDRIEDYCDALADQTLADRELATQCRRLLKKHVLLLDESTGPGILQINQPYQERLDAAIKKRHPNAVILNTLPLEQVMKAFRDEDTRRRHQEQAQLATKTRAPKR